jgi:hypothetical protein
LGTAARNQNCIDDKIKSRLNLGNACSSRLFSKYIKIKIRKTIILPAILYGCENLFPILREEHILRVSENKVLRRIFALKREEVEGGWRRLHNEELHNFYTSPNIITVTKSRKM